MDPTISPTIASEGIQLGIRLTELMAKNTSSWVSTKLAQAKTKSDKEEMAKSYEEIINTLLMDNMELQRMSLTYKELYEKVTISDESITHLQNTLRSTIGLIERYAPSIAKEREGIELVVELLNKDTLKTMQLLGFNYKEAIGEPLTQLCSNLILSRMSTNTNSSRAKKK